MAENGAGTPPPFIKQEQDSPDGPPQNGDDHSMRCISISERRAAKSGFNADAVRLTNLRPYVTIPSGLSPSALLDSSMVLLPNAQAPLSPTTGTFHPFPPPTPNHENLKLKLNLDEEDDAIEPDKSEPHSDEFTVDNLTFAEYLKEDFQEIAKSNENTQSNNNNDRPNYQEIKNLPPKIAYSPKEVAKHSEDGFYWRKYGQKHVKGSEFPRSYYKCTNTNCLVKKKVERSHAGEVTEIVYKGRHNHPQPNPLNNRRSNEEGACFKAEGATFETDHHWIPDSSPSVLGEFHDGNTLIVQSYDSPSEISPNTGEDRNQASPDTISFKEEDDECNNPENEQKKRKRENVNLNLQQNETMIPRLGRESKVVVQIESDVDILDDGYRWRKYGQKVVKGNPNPRSYYKCTTPRCPVRKHVERAADDIKSVLTTYEGKHNHDVPASKTGSLAIPDASNQLQQTVASNIGSNSSPMVQKPKQVEHNLPLYMERKPILSYNDFMRSNLGGNFAGNHHDLGGFGGSPSVFPYSFPPFPSLGFNSLLMNGGGNMTKPYSSSSSKLYPSDYMPQIPMGGFGLNSCYTAGLQNQMRECQVGSVVKPKEEQMGDEDEAYDHACLSTANRGNGSL